MGVQRVNFRELLKWMPEDGLVLAGDIKEHMNEIKEVLEDNQILLKDATNVILKDMLVTYMKLLREIDLKKVDPIIRSMKDNEEVNFELTLSSLGIPKDNFETATLVFMLAMLDISDVCWISKPTVINLGDKELKSVAFRCLKITGTSYVLVHSLYDVYLDEKEEANTMIYEIGVIRLIKHDEFYNALIASLVRYERKDVLDVLRNIDDLINGFHVAEKILGSGENMLKGPLSSSTYFQ